MTHYPHTLKATAAPDSSRDLVVVEIAKDAVESATKTVEQMVHGLLRDKPLSLADCGMRNQHTLVIHVKGRAPPDGSFSRVIADTYLESTYEAVRDHVESYSCAVLEDGPQRMCDIVQSLLALQGENEGNDSLTADVIITNNSEDSEIMLPDCGDTVTIDGVEYTNSPYRARVKLSPGSELKVRTTYYQTRDRVEMMNKIGRYRDAVRILYGPAIVPREVLTTPLAPTDAS